MKKEGYNIQELTELWDKLGGDIYVDLEECPIRLRDSNEEAPKSLVIQAIMPYVKQYIDVYEKNIGEQSLIPYADEAAKQLRESDLCAALSWLDGEHWHKDYDWFDALDEANKDAEIDDEETDGDLVPYLINGWAPFLYAYCRYDAWNDDTYFLDKSVAYWVDLIEGGFMVGTKASIRAIRAAKRGVLFFHTKDAETCAKKWGLLKIFSKYHDTYNPGSVIVDTDVIPAGAKSVEKRKFANRKSLSSITIPDSVTEICESAFIESGLTNIAIPDNVTIIGKDAFWGCSKLKSVSIGQDLKEIGERAFFQCSQLKSISLCNGLKEIGESAFQECSRLAEIHYNGTIKEWNAIEKAWDWDYATGKYTVFCKDGNIKKGR